jgi:hypothetical protein
MVRSRRGPAETHIDSRRIYRTMRAGRLGAGPNSMITRANTAGDRLAFALLLQTASALGRQSGEPTRASDAPRHHDGRPEVASRHVCTVVAKRSRTRSRRWNQQQDGNVNGRHQWPPGFFHLCTTGSGSDVRSTFRITQLAHGEAPAAHPPIGRSVTRRGTRLAIRFPMAGAL